MMNSSFFEFLKTCIKNWVVRVFITSYVPKQEGNLYGFDWESLCVLGVSRSVIKIVQIKNHLLATCSRQKSYADVRLKPLEFKVGDMVLLKVSPWKGASYPKELKGIHSTFHVSNLKKYLAEDDVAVPINEIQLNNKLHMIEELVEVMDREVKRLKQSRIPMVKVRWNSQRGPEFTWEREDQIKKKYLHLFTSKDEAKKQIRRAEYRDVTP
uniref:Putative reverse transcriptase domain-containing protein n=1 Tax=Tanacetum cinerariifolium TaxID=118510 RepID=A0A6L2J883_TANCI|nr:putative reverse transcriptase domain-containing protein [Tanacetum cinerariifolium]